MNSNEEEVKKKKLFKKKEKVKKEKPVKEKKVKKEKVKKEKGKKEKVKKEKVKKKFRISIFTILVFLMDVCVGAGLYVIHMPKFKTFWVTSAMTTMTHQYLAYMLYDEATINKIMSENYI